MKFLVDGMLGGLARWLRILGHDVRYESSATDNEMLQIAEKENMILLTRDAELSKRATAKKLSSLLVVEETEEERLAQIARTFGISLDVTMTSTKCPECGSSLNEAPKTEVAAKVPEASRMLHDKFWKCTGCGKVYWQGSHWKQIRQTLGNAKKIAGSIT
jgi:uncharacterized protein